ncbi:MAG: gliding motility-associated protein GldL [Salibacteraceae bacterium]|jgi:gliding motility-associated protein GldL
MSKEITGFKPGSKSWKNFMKYVYGWGAAIVIIGALFKLQHYPGSGPMLVLGLGTEAIIFFLSAFDPMHEDPDWSLVYPELAEDYSGDPRGVQGGGGGSATQELDSMLEEAKIGPDLIESLGAGMRNLAETAGNMNNLGDASASTNTFVDSLEGAAKNVNELSDSYHNATEALTGLSVSNEDGATYADNLRKVSENLSALNGVYEMQLEQTTNSNKVSSEMFNNMQQLVENLNDSVEDTKRYKENIAELSTNLESLNTVYGNMLSAMNVNRS